MLAPLGHDAIEKAPARRRELRAVRKKKTSKQHGQQKLERSNSGVTRKGEHGACQWFQIGRNFPQRRANVAGSLIPKVVKLLTNEWPILDAFGGGWNRQITRTQTSGDGLQP